MLTHQQTETIATTLWSRLGETALAAAVLRAHQAEERGDDAQFADWRQVAAALERLAEPHLDA